jgi:hypothetical protein
MKSLASMALELPEVYKSYKTFINISVLGEGEKEIMGSGAREQVDFQKKFYMDLEEEKARWKGKAVASVGGTRDSLEGSVNGSGEE